MKLRLPMLLNGVGRRIILQRLDHGRGIPNMVSAEVPFLTENVVRKRRTFWCRKYKRLTGQDWEKVMFCDESPFHTEKSTRGRRVIRPRLPNGYDPKYTRSSVKKPQTVNFWGGINALGKRVCVFFEQNESMNSVNYIKILKKNPVKILKEENLTLCHDLARTHMYKQKSNYLAKEGIQTIFTPPTSPDMMPIA